MAGIGDLFTDAENGGPPEPTTVSSTRTPGATTLQCEALTNWPTTASAVHFVTGTPTTDAEGNPIINPATLCLWKGVVSGTEINDLVLRGSPADSDPGNNIGDIVQMAPDSSWAHDMFEGATAEHDTEGHHTNITPETATFPNGIEAGSALETKWNQAGETWAYASANTITVPTNATTKYDVGDIIQFTQSSTVKYFGVIAVSTTLLTLVGFAGATVANSTITSPFYSKQAPHGLVGCGPIFNPVKFSLSFTSAFTPGSSAGIIPFDTKVFDTSNNTDITTNKGRFTAPVTGLYQFIYTLSTTSSSIGISLNKNGSQIAPGSLIQGITSSLNSISSSALIPLVATDYVETRYFVNDMHAFLTGVSGPSFQGSLVGQI